MKRSATLIWLVAVLAACSPALAQTGKKAAKAKKAAGVKPADVKPAEGEPAASKTAGEPQRFRMNPYHANVGKVTAVTPEGIVRIADVANPRFAFDRETANQTDLVEGLYLGIIARDFLLTTEDAKLFRVQVADVGARGTAVVRVGPVAARNIKAGEDIILFRPPGSTTTELKEAPDFAPVEDTSGASALGGSGRLGLRERAQLAQSRNNLKQIGLAYHNFHDTYGTAPPTYLADADGKPLLSWRVLLLPFLEQQSVYDQFRFDEPWDGPNNKKLLDKMPSVYADPIHGKPGSYTHYAAITGKDTGFPLKGPKVTDAKNWAKDFKRGRDSISFAEMTDGTSNTIIIGSVSPEAKIPWTKPEDIELADDFPGLGKTGGFAAPYRTSTAAYGVFLFGDASTRTIRSDIEAQTLHRLLRMNDGFSIGEYPTLDEPRRREPSTPQVQMIEIVRGKDGPKARFITVPGPSGSTSRPTSRAPVKAIEKKVVIEPDEPVSPAPSSPPSPLKTPVPPTLPPKVSP
jgi:hypothetical protein